MTSPRSEGREAYAMVRKSDDNLFHGEVLGNAELTSVMRRLVLGGPGLSDFRSTGFADEWLRLWVPADPEPVPRWYTVRAWDGHACELTIDLVMHDHGLATSWAMVAAPGEVVQVSAPTGRYRLSPGTDWVLVIADQTGLAAASRIIEETPAGQPAYAILEAPDEAAVLQLGAACDLEVRWVFNPAPGQAPSPLEAATRSFPLPPGRGFVWMAGESSSARDIRRYFRHELGWRSGTFDIAGYWRPDAAHYLKRYAAIEGEVAAIWDSGEAVGRDTEAIADDIFAVMESHGL